MATPEQHRDSLERSEELQRAAAERSEQLQGLEKERKSEAEPKEGQLEEARLEAHREAKRVSEHRPSTDNEQRPTTFVASAERETAYRQTMDSVQRQLPPTSRVFSKFIHNKTVERLSDGVAATVARPTAVLSGAVCAFFLVLALYVHARYLGYRLSGFESIATFALGWMVGLVLDILRSALRRRRG